MQKSALIQPRTSLSKPGGCSMPVFIRLLIEKPIVRVRRPGLGSGFDDLRSKLVVRRRKRRTDPVPTKYLVVYNRLQLTMAVHGGSYDVASSRIANDHAASSAYSRMSSSISAPTVQVALPAAVVPRSAKPSKICQT